VEGHHRHQEESSKEPEALLPPSGKLETYSEISHKAKEAAEVVDAGKIVNIATV